MKIIDNTSNKKYTYDQEEFTLTEDYIISCLIMLQQHMILMAKVEAEYLDCWTCGAIVFNDFCTTSPIHTSFSGIEDIEMLKDYDLVLILEKEELEYLVNNS